MDVLMDIKTFCFNENVQERNGQDPSRIPTAPPRPQQNRTMPTASYFS